MLGLLTVDEHLSVGTLRDADRSACLVRIALLGSHLAVVVLGGGVLDEAQVQVAMVPTAVFKFI